MTLFLLILWLVVVSVQLLFILFIYSRTAFRPVTAPADVNHAEPGVATAPADRPGTEVPGTAVPDTAVSVIVCAWNELANLRELLPLLDAQQYPAFEVLVIDDRSTDGTREWLEAEAGRFRHVRFLRVDQDYDHITPKKYAVTIAMKKALHPIALLTDADCRPAGPYWLAGMVGQLDGPERAVVLGFSPYVRRPGLLNRLIRFETLFTAVQYLSLALAGRPYMGVGRNLLYRRQLFFANKGFYSHLRVLGGDDDLFINEVATARNTTVSLHPDTFAWSAPKETWAAWRHQKRRHLHVGHYYKPVNKLLLGLLTGTHVLTWVLALVVAGLSPWLAPGPWLWGALGLFGFRGLAFWAIVGRISYRLGHTVRWYGMPVMDVVLAGYYGLMGTTTLLRRQRPLRWR